MTDLHAVPDPPDVRELLERELRSVVPFVPLAEPIDYRLVELNAAHIGCVEEAARELRRAGFMLIPAMLERVAARWHEAPSVVTACTCGGDGVCTVCVLAALEAERYPDGAA